MSPSQAAPEIKETQRKSFFAYYRSMFLAPSRTLAELLRDDRRVKFGFFAVLIPALGYTLFYIMASAAGGAPSTFKP